MAIKTINTFQAGDELEDQHIDFLRDVLNAQEQDNGKVALSPKRHFGVGQELTQAGAISINNAMSAFKASGACLPGKCPVTANNCYQSWDPDTGQWCYTLGNKNPPNLTS